MLLKVTMAKVPVFKKNPDTQHIYFPILSNFVFM